MFARLSNPTNVLRRKRTLELAVDQLETRNLLSTAVALATPASVASLHALVNVASANLPKPATPHQDALAASAAGADPTYFFALIVSSKESETVKKAAQDPIEKAFPNKVKKVHSIILINWIHISLVRDVPSSPSLSALKKEVTNVVNAFEKLDGKISTIFTFTPTNGTVAPPKSTGFYVYKLTANQPSAFTTLATDLANHIGGTAEKATSTHMSVFFSEKASNYSTIGSELKKLKKIPTNPFGVSKLALLESNGNHHYSILDSWK